MFDNEPPPEAPRRQEPHRLDKAAFDLINGPLCIAYKALINNLLSRSSLFVRDPENEPLVIAVGHLQRAFRALDLSLVEADRYDTSGGVEERLYRLADDLSVSPAMLGYDVLNLTEECRWPPNNWDRYANQG